MLKIDDYIVFLGEGIYDQDDGEDYGIYDGHVLQVEEIISQDAAQITFRDRISNVVMMLNHGESYRKATPEEVFRSKLL
jgi:hypothetical protein